MTDRPTPFPILSATQESRPWLKPALLTVGVLLVLGSATPWLVGPACPKRVVIATGSDMGAYYAFAQKYQPLLKSAGIQLEVRQTAGSVENASLLRDPDSGVSVAIMQGGTAGASTGSNLGSISQQDLADSGIQSLASLFQEPIWVFYRADGPIKRLADLRGKRVAVGAPGSGTRAVALELLADNGMIVENNASDTKILNVLGEVDVPKTTLLCQGTRDASQSLKSGKVDAAFFVVAPTAPVIGELMRDPNIHLLSFDRTLAYKRRHPYLTSVTISEGMLDLEHNLPKEDVELLAPTAVLVARDDLHPALIPLFLKAASQVHEGGGVLEVPREFPSEDHVEYPLNVDAQSYLRSGPSFLYRNLPFSMAAWVDQMKLMLLPLCTLLIPLIKAAPPLYRWRIRSKIYTWYRVLRRMDQARQESERSMGPFIEELQQVERELSEISVPLSYMEEFYNLRWHVAFVLEQLERQQEHRGSLPVEASDNANDADIRNIPKSNRQFSKSSHAA
ncbi:MAG: TAXI family TRAP transporter solute-binding subunit [Planctomycetaceae bacterium]|nr:TAXI family TRAP transporter solute-binding subunit [Planctomycetaceae bacterium]